MEEIFHGRVKEDLSARYASRGNGDIIHVSSPSYPKKVFRSRFSRLVPFFVTGRFPSLPLLLSLHQNDKKVRLLHTKGKLTSLLLLRHPLSDSVPFPFFLRGFLFGAKKGTQWRQILRYTI